MTTVSTQIPPSSPLRRARSNALASQRQRRFGLSRDEADGSPRDVRGAQGAEGRDRGSGGRAGGGGAVPGGSAEVRRGGSAAAWSVPGIGPSWSRVRSSGCSGLGMLDDERVRASLGRVARSVEAARRACHAPGARHQRHRPGDWSTSCSPSGARRRPSRHSDGLVTTGDQVAAERLHCAAPAGARP